MNATPYIAVFTPYFRAATSERQAELDLCLRLNLQCPAIDTLILLIDDGHVPPIQSPKLRIVSIASRPTYQQWVQLTKQLERPGISVLANSDIYFDETIAALNKYLDKPQRFVALSRYEKVAGALRPHPNPHWSQDVWAINAEADLPLNLIKALDIPLGVPRCDNKVAYLFAVNGWKIFNPISEVKSVHVHETQQRNYDKRTDLTVIGGVAYVHPSAGEAPSKIDIDIWARGTEAIERVALNKSLDKWLGSPIPESGEARLAEDGSLFAPHVRAALAEGRAVYVDELKRFKVIEYKGRYYAYDSLRRSFATMPLNSFDIERAAHQATLLAAVVPPVQDIAPLVVRDKPIAPDDVQFWQYPAATERQAWQNHIEIATGANVDQRTRTVHTYLALPWATYIDKKRVPEDVTRYLVPRLRGLHRLAARLGWRLRVHTVCQHIHWRRLVDTWHALHVTDVHLSHATKNIDPESEGWIFRVNSWPLIAPNIEDPDRREGLVFGKPINERRWFASFIGAHMRHYLSEVRLQLRDAAKNCGREDVFVEVTDEWHFNKTVYVEQVQHKPLDAHAKESERNRTRCYNQVLSDTIFSLCPEGAGPNTLRLWESLAVGAIPVIIADGWVEPMIRNSAIQLRDCCIFVARSDVTRIFSLLNDIDRSQIEEMHFKCLNLYPAIKRHRAF